MTRTHISRSEKSIQAERSIAAHIPLKDTTVVLDAAILKSLKNSNERWVMMEIKIPPVKEFILCGGNPDFVREIRKLESVNVQDAIQMQSAIRALESLRELFVRIFEDYEYEFHVNIEDKKILLKIFDQSMAEMKKHEGRNFGQTGDLMRFLQRYIQMIFSLTFADDFCYCEVSDREP